MRGAGERHGAPAPSLVVFSDDWGRHPSSCQHLIGRLTVDHPVWWINTIGTRRPALDWATMRRGAGKLASWVRPREARRVRHSSLDTTDLQVLNPMMWPWFSSSWDRRINRRLLTSAVNRAIAPAPHTRVAVTTIPLTADLIGHLDVDAWVYYCVDDLAAWPGLDGPALRSMERELVARADAIVAAGDALRVRIKEMGREATVVEHGVDLGHWQSVQSKDNKAHQTLELPAGSVVFWGLIDDRLETEWVERLADHLPEGRVVLVGPVESAPPRLSDHPRVQLTGPLPYADLPQLARQAAALIMPYREITATRAMQPLKLKEYMATGLPCIVRALPSTEPWSDAVDVARTCDDFVKKTISRIAQGVDPQQQAARERLCLETWDAKAEAFREILVQAAQDA